MNLNEIPRDLGIETVRDGQFTTLGLVAHSTPDLLVFLEAEKYLQPLRESPRVRCVIAAPEL